MQFYWMKDRVKQNIFVYTGNQDVKTWEITSKTSPATSPKTQSTYLYMSNTILKLNHTVVQGWSNVVIKLNHTFLQECVDVVRTYIWTHKSPNCNIDQMAGRARVWLSYHP